jgi:hypothetical protein
MVRARGREERFFGREKFSIALYPTMTGSMLAASDEHGKRAAVSKACPALSYLQPIR